MQRPIGLGAVLPRRRALPALIGAHRRRVDRKVRPLIDLGFEHAEEVLQIGFSRSNCRDRLVCVERKDVLNDGVRAQDVIPLKQEAQPLDQIVEENSNLVKNELNCIHYGVDAVQSKIIEVVSNFDEKVGDVVFKLDKKLADIVVGGGYPAKNVARGSLNG